MNVDQYYELYKEGKINNEEMIDFLGQINNLALKKYWGGFFPEYMKVDELHSLVNEIFSKALKRYNPNNEKKASFTTYITTAINYGLLHYIRDNKSEYKQTACYISDLVNEGKDGKKEETLDRLFGKQDEELENNIIYDELRNEILDNVMKLDLGNRVVRPRVLIEERRKLFDLVLSALEHGLTQYQTIDFLEAHGLRKYSQVQISRFIAKICKAAKMCEEFKYVKLSRGVSC